MKQTWGFRLAPRQWPTLFRKVKEHPEDVALGARVFFSVGGHDEGGAYKRFMRTAAGRRLVEERVDYPELFMDTARLRELPRGTLGRTYVEQLDARGIDPKALAALTEPCYEGIDFSPDHAYVRDRVRHAHDMIHTLTDAGVELNGEVGVAAFTFGQTGNKGWWMLVVLNILTALSAFRFNGISMAVNGFLRGRRARFIPAVDDWERLLRLPLAEARAELGVVPFEQYRPLHLEELFENASGSASQT